MDFLWLLREAANSIPTQFTVFKSLKTYYSRKHNENICQKFYHSAVKNFQRVFANVKKIVGDSKNMIDDVKNMIGFLNLGEIMEYYAKYVRILHTANESADKWILTRK